MKKVSVRFFGLILAIILVVLSGINVLAFSKKTVKHYDVYTCLGDSNAAGFGTSGYLYSPIPSSTAYHSLVAEATGAELRQFALGASRSVDMLYMLDPEFEMDWSYSFRAGSDIHIEQFDNFRDDYIKAVEDADLITVQIGLNDLSENINGILALYGAPIEKIETIKEKVASNAALTMIVSLVEQFAKLIKVSTALYTYGKDVTVTFAENFDRIMKNIFRLNPDVDVVALGVCNPLDDVKLAKQLPIGAGKVYAIATEQVNNWIKYKSEYRKQYRYCDISGIDYPTGYLTDLPQDVEYQFYVIHMLDDGHAEIAKRIIDVLPKE